MSFTLSELRGPDAAPETAADALPCEALLPLADAAFPAWPDAAADPRGEARRALLHRLLDEHAARPPEYRAGLSNHLPMALHALHELGAEEDRMRAFAERYVRRFVPDDAPPPGAPVAGDWTRRIGRFEAFESLRGRFARDLADEGVDAVLRRALPPLMEGVAAAAFHGVIRTAHGVEAGHDGEVAAGLAYWAARWQPLPAMPDPVPASSRIEDPGEWLDALDAAWRRLDKPPAVRRPLISERTVEAAGSRAWARLAGALRTDHVEPGRQLSSLALACARRYADSRNLTVLHLVTGSRAVRVLARWLPEDGRAMAPWWHAVAAASLSSGVAVPSAAPGAPVPERNWYSLKRAAIAQDDDHVVKIVHALWQLEATRDHPDGRRAAAVAVAG